VIVCGYFSFPCYLEPFGWYSTCAVAPHCPGWPKSGESLRDNEVRLYVSAKSGIGKVCAGIHRMERVFLLRFCTQAIRWARGLVTQLPTRSCWLHRKLIMVRELCARSAFPRKYCPSSPTRGLSTTSLMRIMAPLGDRVGDPLHH